MPNTEGNNGFNMGQIANLLGNEEEDKKRFFSEEVQGRPWASALPARTGSTSSLQAGFGDQQPSQVPAVAPPTANTSLSASTIPQVSVASTGGWGQAIQNTAISSASSISQPPADVNTNQQSNQQPLSTAEALNNIKAQEAQRIAAREARKQAEAAERERKRQQLQEDQRLRREARQREQEQLQLQLDDDDESPNTQTPKSPSHSKKLTNSPSRSSLLSLSQNTSEQAAFRTTNTENMNTVVAPNPSLPCRDCISHTKRISELEEQLRICSDTLAEKTSLHTQEVDQLTHQSASLSEKVEQLQTENELLRAKMEGRSIRKDIGNGIIEMVTKEEVAIIKQEIQSQEALCSAYQTDAEKNTREIKYLKSQVTELQKELLIEKKSPSKNNNSTFVHDAPDSTTQVVRDLTREVSQLKEKLRIQQEEHTLALTAVEKEKRNLASKLGQHDIHKADDDALKIRDLELQLKKQKHAYEEELSSVKEKLLWYVKNQELLSNKDNLVEQQVTEIETLKSRVVELDSKPLSGGRRNQPCQKQYVSELQKKIKDLEDIVKSKYPNSIPELIRACKPTPTEIELYRTLQERIDVLNTEISTREQEYEKGIRLLRQESDKVTLQYQERQKVLEEELKIKVRAATNSKIKELERRIEDTRTYYVKKVRELEQQLLELRKTAIRGKGTTTANDKKSNKSSHPKSTTAVQTDGGEFPMNPVATSSGNSGQKDQIHVVHQQPSFGYGSPVISQDLAYQSMEIGRLRSELEAQRRSDSDRLSELSTLRHSLSTAQRDLDQATIQKSNLQDEITRLQTASNTLTQQHAVREQELLAKHRYELDSQKQQWDEDVRRLSTNQPIHEPALTDKSDRMAYISSIKRKLAALEREHSIKHSEFQRTLTENRRLASFELDVQKQKMNLVIQSKTNEIQRFRLALDSLMEELTALKSQKEVQLFSKTA
eukprot:TRINITY_DN4987_c1_g2_i2.p1 TRINITY_DN4987_c1_g2~~TRINITY_DN4987_c1_g2_i2.p1  ORF type:complete len:944 (+),score=267.95 TRINITY_DN4987_c1_g2_i2:67-2898(+)